MNIIVATKAEFVAEFHKFRKAHKNSWLFVEGLINGQPIATKSWNTWIQILRDQHGRRSSGPMDCSVKDLNEYLDQALAGYTDEVVNELHT